MRLAGSGARVPHRGAEVKTSTSRAARGQKSRGGGQGIQYLVSLQWPVVQLDFSDGMHMTEKSNMPQSARKGAGRDEGWHIRNTEKMVAMPPDPAAVSARTLRESCLPGRCGPRAAPIIETRGCSCLVQARKLGEKPRQALRKRKTKAPCDRRPSRARIHIVTWFHRP